MERCTAAAVYFEHGRPLCYSLFREGQQADPKPVRGIQPVLTTFDEAYRLFPAIRRHYTPDGTPIEAEAEA